MGAWGDLSNAVKTALTGAGYVLATTQEPAEWPSHAVGASGAPSWVAFAIEPTDSPINGSSAMTRSTLTIRALAGHPWSWSASEAAALDFARAVRALLDTASGLSDVSAQLVFDSVSASRVGACYSVSVQFEIYQTDTY